MGHPANNESGQNDILHCIIYTNFYYFKQRGAAAEHKKGEFLFLETRLYSIAAGAYQWYTACPLKQKGRAYADALYQRVGQIRPDLRFDCRKILIAQGRHKLNQLLRLQIPPLQAQQQTR